MYKLKQIPADFIVKEISLTSLTKELKQEPEKEHNHLYFTLKKENYNTIQALEIIAKRLNLSVKHFGFAGAKDKHAITTQICSVHTTKAKRKVTKEQLQKISKEFKEQGTAISIKPLGYAKNPTNLGDLEANHFQITVRNLTPNNYKIQTLKYSINYFDEQRFSKNNAKVGKFILKKEFKEAAKLVTHKQVQESLKNNPSDAVGALQKLPRRIALLYTHAYQSYLWNETVAQLLKEETKKEVQREQKYSLGTFTYLTEKAKSSYVNVTIPLLGFTNLNRLPKQIESITEELLKKEDIDEDDFVIKQLPYLSLEGTTRPLLAEVKNFQATKLQADELSPNKEKITITFTLPKGAYATQVVAQCLLLS